MEKDINNNNYVKNQNHYNEYKEYINNDILKLYYQFIHLKSLYRQGWLTHILDKSAENKVESVADHSWSVAMLSMSVIQKYKLDLDLEKCMKLAIVHELGEIYAGDFIPNQISKEEKHNLEAQAVDTVLDEVSFDNDFKELWLEFENQTSEEAVFVKQIDKIEPILQSIAYGIKPKDFFNTDTSYITIPCLREIVEDAYKLSEQDI